MSKTMLFTAIALMAISSPALASGNFILYNLETISTTECGFIKGESSAARGSIYDLAGHGTCSDQQILTCEITILDIGTNQIKLLETLPGRCEPPR